MGYAVIGTAFGLIMLGSAIAGGFSLAASILIGWLGASMGVICVAGLMAARLQARDRIEERTAEG
jgi:hypothetical protein